MARKSIQDIELTIPRRSTVKAQVDALPPRVAVANFNPNTGFRRPYMHGYYSGRADLRYGPDSPALARAREALEDQGAPQDVIDALDLDELVVTPDLISGGPEGFNIATNISEPRRNDSDIIAGRYEPTGESEILVVQNGVDWTSSAQQYQSRAFPGPCYVRDFNLSMTSTNNAGYTTVSASGVGQLWAGIPTNGVITGSTGVRTINKLVEFGSVQLLMYITNASPGTSMGDMLFATLVVERARRVA